MCLNSKWRFPKRAKKDIVCYKILEKVKMDNSDKKYYTPYQYTEIDITKPFKAKGISLSFSNYEKTKGYIHTISDLGLVKYYIYGIGCSHPVVFKCIIPKGTKYHKSQDDDEYCSRKIIFDKQIQSYEIYNIH